MVMQCSIACKSHSYLYYSCRLIEELRKKDSSWREIFWKLWGLAHVLVCSTCLGHFPAADLPLCRHHPGAPVFAQGRSSGVYVLLHCRPMLHSQQSHFSVLMPTTPETTSWIKNIHDHSRGILGLPCQMFMLFVTEEALTV